MVDLTEEEHAAITATLKRMVHAVQMMNFYSLPPPKTSANWPRSIPHRSKCKKPERKGACAFIPAPHSALAARCFSTESADC